jgi:hypothetical protein
MAKKANCQESTQVFVVFLPDRSQTLYVSSSFQPNLDQRTGSQGFGQDLSSTRTSSPRNTVRHILQISQNPHKTKN